MATSEKTADEIMDDVKKIKGEGSLDNQVLLARRAVIAGAITGLVFGIYYGSSKGHNPVWTGIAGSIVGGLITRVFVTKE